MKKLRVMNNPAEHTIDDLPVLFTFVEGQFGYNCQTCDARCCRQVGQLKFGDHQKALVKQLGLEHADLRQQAAGFEVELGFGGCPALTADNFCTLHASGGLENKPALCTLFPLTRLLRAPKFLLVSPQLTFVCPLNSQAEATDTYPKHQEFIKQINYFYKKPQDLFAHLNNPASDLDWQREQDFVDACQTPLDPTIGLIGLLAAFQDQELEGFVNSLHAGLDLLLQPWPQQPLLGLEQDLLPLIPTLRSYCLDIEDAARAKVLALAPMLMRQRFRASILPMNPRQLASQFFHFLPLLKLLARANDPVALKSPPSVKSFASPQVAVDAMAIFRAIEKKPKQKSLIEWCSMLNDNDPTRRIQLLHVLAKAPLRWNS